MYLHIGMVLLKFFCAVKKKPDLPNSVIEWHWLVTNNSYGKKLNDDEDIKD